MQLVCRSQWLVDQRLKVLLEGLLGGAVRDNTWQQLPSTRTMWREVQDPCLPQQCMHNSMTARGPVCSWTSAQFAKLAYGSYFKCQELDTQGRISKGKLSPLCSSGSLLFKNVWKVWSFLFFPFHCLSCYMLLEF